MLKSERHLSEYKPAASNFIDLFNNFNVGEDISLWLWLNTPQLKLALTDNTYTARL